MNILIGASGYIGKELVPLLASHATHLALIGRDKNKLKSKFPNHSIYDYDDLKNLTGSWDCIIHLAVANNKKDFSIEKSRKVNVELFQHIVRFAKEHSIPRVVNFSYTHALVPMVRTPYAITKREAFDWSKKVKDIQIDTVFLPFVYGNTWSEGLNFLNKIPRPLADFLFLILKSLKPSVKIQTIADWLQVSANPIKNQILLSEGQANNIIYQFSKRVFDVCAALFIIVAFCWLFAIISLVIFVSSGSPILFRQTRVGKNMEPFVLFKFRTMEAETKDLPTHLVSVSSVTKVGKFLRKIKLDEMPQVFNILRNDLRRPRPSLINQKE